MQRPLAARADGLTSQTEVKVAIRTLNFVSSLPPGTTTLAIVYAPEIALSAADAKATLAVIESEVLQGRTVIQPVLMPMTMFTAQVASHAALVTHGMEPYYDQIAALSRDQRVLTISTEVSCVQSGRCVMGIVSQPRVQVTVNHAAADAAHVEFSTAFRMLINEQ